MAFFKNLAGQKAVVYAHDTAGDAPKTADAANITAQISLDAAAPTASNDVNPTELDAANMPGVYVFDLTQAETNGELFVLAAVSSTGNVQIEPLVIHTTQPTGNGANQIDVTVDDGSDPLEGATVRFTNGAESYAKATDASGNVSFALDAATWNVTITKPGYSFTPTTLVVSGAATPNYSMTAVSITPSAPSQTTAYLTTYDPAGVAEVGVTVNCKPVQTGAAAGRGYDDTTRAVVSDGSGLVQFTGLFPGVTYEFWRGTSSRIFKVTIPATAGATYELPSIIGAT